MSIFRLVEVSFSSAKAAIDTATSAGDDADAALMRAGVIEFLRVHASQVVAEGNDAELLDAYRRWLDIAVDVYGLGKASRIPDYMRAAGMLTAELQLAEARANGALVDDSSDQNE